MGSAGYVLIGIAVGLLVKFAIHQRKEAGKIIDESKSEEKNG